MKGVSSAWGAAGGAWWRLLLLRGSMGQAVQAEVEVEAEAEAEVEVEVEAEENRVEEAWARARVGRLSPAGRSL